MNDFPTTPLRSTHDQGADRSADRKPREVRGDLIERLLACAATREAETEGRFVPLTETHAIAAGYRSAAQALAVVVALLNEKTTALTAQDARVAELKVALQPFADFYDCRAPDDLPVSTGSRLAKRQLVMGDCFRAYDALTRNRGPLT